ncbi:MAG: F0F1 ATP synthase subunit epsilon [Polyangia bacterium]
MRLSVTTPRGAIVETDIDEITAPGTVGEFGVLPGHVPMMAALKPGVLTYRVAERTTTLAVGEGFLQVAPAVVGNAATATATATDRVLVLVDQAVAAPSIDAVVARKELSDTEAQLTAWKGELDGTYQELIVRRDWSLAKVGAAARVTGSS